MILISPDKRFPLFLGDLQLEHPDYKKGQELPSGWFEIEMPELPLIGDTETHEYGVPYQSNGKYQCDWVVRQLTEEELLAFEATLDSEG